MAPLTPRHQPSSTDHATGQQASLGSLERAAARAHARRRLLIGIGIVAAIPAAFIALVVAAYFGTFDRLDREALHAGVLASQSATDSVRAVEREIHKKATDDGMNAPAKLQAAINQWVVTVNSMNGNAIVLLGTDGFANSYITFSAVYDTLPKATQMKVVDKLGNYYRSFLSQVLGPVPTGTTFAPGLLILDTLGLQAANRNGRIEWCRAWNQDQRNPDGSAPCRVVGLQRKPGVAGSENSPPE